MSLISARARGLSSTDLQRLEKKAVVTEFRSNLLLELGDLSTKTDTAVARAIQEIDDFKKKYVDSRRVEMSSMTPPLDIKIASTVLTKDEVRPDPESSTVKMSHADLYAWRTLFSTLKGIGYTASMLTFTPELDTSGPVWHNACVMVFLDCVLPPLLHEYGLHSSNLPLLESGKPLAPPQAQAVQVARSQSHVCPSRFDLLKQDFEHVAENYNRRDSKIRSYVQKGERLQDALQRLDWRQLEDLITYLNKQVAAQQLYKAWIPTEAMPSLDITKTKLQIERLWSMAKLFVKWDGRSKDIEEKLAILKEIWDYQKTIDAEYNLQTIESTEDTIRHVLEKQIGVLAKNVSMHARFRESSFAQSNSKAWKALHDFAYRAERTYNGAIKALEIMDPHVLDPFSGDITNVTSRIYRCAHFTTNTTMKERRRLLSYLEMLSQLFPTYWETTICQVVAPIDHVIYEMQIASEKLQGTAKVNLQTHITELKEFRGSLSEVLRRREEKQSKGLRSLNGVKQQASPEPSEMPIKEATHKKANIARSDGQKKAQLPLNGGKRRASPEPSEMPLEQATHKKAKGRGGIAL